MKLWLDDIRPAPEGYVWCKSVNQAKSWLMDFEARREALIHIIDRTVDIAKLPQIEAIDVDHDAGDYATDGGDYINFLNWLEETGRNYPIHIHSMNPVGIQNMKAIIEKNGWKTV